ncbi:MAG: nucleoside-triphosphatase [Elusimicrobiota bacterium]
MSDKPKNNPIRNPSGLPEGSPQGRLIPNGAKNLFITGKPGSGKTSLIREACLPFMQNIGGFYTEEIRSGAGRDGFILKTFDGKHGVLAKKGMESPHKLNKYGLDLDVLDSIGVDSIRAAMEGKRVVVIDEIGSMEVFSELFRKVLVECLGSKRRVLASIRYNAQPFTDEIKKMPDTALVYLSRENFIDTKKQVKQWLEAACREQT